MDLTHYNPWWKSGGLWEDLDLGRLKKSPLHYRPRVFSPADCTAGAVYTLRGPRRAGKTVCLKLFIAELIEQEGWDPRQIAWSNLETAKDPKEMENHLLEVLASISPRLLVIDEVTSVVGWRRVVKKVVDAGKLSRTTLILTGSSAHDLKRDAERVAARRRIDQSPDRVLLPMDYGEFSRQLERRGIAPSTDLFFGVGGFPFRVEEFLSRDGRLEALGPSTQVFDDIIAYEFNRRKLDRPIALEVIGRLAAVQSHATSFERFAKSLSVSRETAKRYLEALGDAYLLVTLSSFDTSRGRVAPRKDRKFHWIDPSLAHLAAWLRVGEAPAPGALAEACVGSAVLRQVEQRLWEGLAAPKQLFTWKSQGGKEIDFLWVDRAEKTRFPVEVKYQDSISDWDFQSVEQGFGRGVLVTRSHRRTRARSRACTVEDFLLRPGDYLRARS